MLSQILDDPAVVKASEAFVRIIVRRPHAYQFRQTFKGKTVPIPGIVFLDANEDLIGASRLESANQLLDRMKELTQ